MYVNTIANIYRDCTTTLLLKKSRKIHIKKGVSQDTTISLFLLTAYLDNVFKQQGLE